MNTTLKTMIRDVADFHTCAGHPPTMPDRVTLRYRLIKEEMSETLVALAQHNLSGRNNLFCIPTCKYCASNRAKVLDGLIDSFYVLLGTAEALGLSEALEPAWERVHKANMAKFAGGLGDRDAGGKIVKPAGWKAPDLTDLV